MTVKAYAAAQQGAALEPFSYKEAKLGQGDAEIAISHCGVCHSDVHLIDNDWGISHYPLVPGHEVVGTVTKIGAAVKNVAVGDRVGVGWQRYACGHCDLCLQGEENLCRDNQATCVGHHGGFADKIRLDARFAFAIPEALASENAAPLLCGGATVYSPLARLGVRSTMRVGVIGIGGLGHLAIQFAAAMGCEVTAFSSTSAKEDEARALGAHQFHASDKRRGVRKLACTQDLIISTVHHDLDWGGYVQALRPNGTLCFVGVPPSKLEIHVGQLLDGQRRICGSMIGGRPAIREMLDFAARHEIVATSEVIAMGDVNAGLARLRANEVRYRLVLTT